MSWTRLERTGKKALNQDFELREASLDFPISREDWTGVNKDPDTEHSRFFVRGQQDDRDRSEFGRGERQEEFRRYPLCPMEPVSNMSARSAKILWLFHHLHWRGGSD